MGCIWFFVFTANPWLLLFGILGIFGKEAQETAQLVLLAEGLGAIVLFVGYLIYLIIHAIASAF